MICILGLGRGGVLILLEFYWVLRVDGLTRTPKFFFLKLEFWVPYGFLSSLEQVRNSDLAPGPKAKLFFDRDYTRIYFDFNDQF